MAKSVCLALFAAALLVASACGQQTLPGVGNVDAELDQCQVILGSIAAGDGTFDKDTDFSATLSDGAWSLPLSSILNNTGDVLYVVPAARSANYAPLSPADRQSAGYCYDTTTLLPEYNPLAVMIPQEGSEAVTVSPISTLLAFGWAYGLRAGSMKMALGLDQAIDASTYNGLAEFVNDPSGPGSTFYKVGVKLQNLVTLGATLLSNSTETYASFAVLLDQSLGRAALNASNNHWNMHLNGTEAALDLNDPATIQFIYMNAGQYVHATKDWTLPSMLNQLPPQTYATVAQATANLNIATDDAASQDDIAKILYYGQNTLAAQVEDLLTSQISRDDFSTATSPSSISTGLANVMLPTAAAAPAPEGPTVPTSIGALTTQAAEQSSSSSSSSGLSGGAIAGIVIGCVVGVALIALAVTLLVRRSGAATTPEGTSRRLWGRRNQDAMGPNTV